MKKAQRVALVGAGRLADSPIARLALAGALGPVKAGSYRLASRFVNGLRAGHAVADYTEFAHCRLILICVPDKMLAESIGDLAAAPVPWSRKAVVLCHAWLGRERLQVLASRGASTGSLWPVPGFEDKRFLMEGDKLVERELRPLVQRRGGKLTAVELSRKHDYVAAMALAGPLIAPLLLAAAQALQRAGVTGLQNSAILEKQVERALRAHLKAGKKAAQLPRDFDSQIDLIAKADPRLGRQIRESVRSLKELTEPSA